MIYNVTALIQRGLQVLSSVFLINLTLVFVGEVEASKGNLSACSNFALPPCLIAAGDGDTLVAIAGQTGESIVSLMLDNLTAPLLWPLPSGTKIKVRRDKRQPSEF